MNTASHSLRPQGDPTAFPQAPATLQAKRIYKGCNIYHSGSVIRQRVDLGVLGGLSSSVAGPDFAPAFLNRFLALKSFIPRNGLDDGFAARLCSPEGAGFDEVLLQAILAVEAAVAFARHELENISFAVIRRRRTYVDLIWESSRPDLSAAAAKVAHTGISELLPESLCADLPNGPVFATSLDELLRRARRRRLSPATAVVRLAAKLKGMPTETTGRQHLRVGQGCRQQSFYASMTGTTSRVAQKICSDKALANRRLRELRLPVPRQVRVYSAEQAQAVAETVGYPVVIKPMRSRKGQGVTAGLRDGSGIARAFAIAEGAGTGVVVERFVTGADHRILVIGGRFVAALTRIPPVITGDGRSTVRELIDAFNADPARDGFRLFKVTIDDEVTRLLAEANLTLDDVPDAGQTVQLRMVANVSTGGLPVDVTERVHPDNRRMAERAAKGVGLDVAGIDFLTTDISRSYREVGGGIVEVNARPGLDIHTWPYDGTMRNVAGELLDHCFRPGNDGRIATIAIAGDHGTGTVARLLDQLLRADGRSVALALRRHAYINGVPAELTETQQNEAARVLLNDPEVETLISTVSLRQTAKRGLGIDGYSVSVILDPEYEDDRSRFDAGVDVMLRATTDCLVVNAENSDLLDRLGKGDQRRLVLVSEHHNLPQLRRHLEAGNTAVVARWRKRRLEIALLSGAKTVFAVPFDRASTISRAGWRRHGKGAMYALAAACGMGLPPTEAEAAVRAWTGLEGQADE